jgi:hypothetical protein
MLQALEDMLDLSKKKKKKKPTKAFDGTSPETESSCFRHSQAYRQRITWQTSLRV